MRFWSPFHRYLLDIVSLSPSKLILRAPDKIRLRLTVDHLQTNENQGSTLTHYNSDTCLWECFHSPTICGQYRLIVWLMDLESDDSRWLTAARFDVNVDEISSSTVYPITSSLFNRHRCQLIKPFDGVLNRNGLPSEIIIRALDISEVQLQIDEKTVIKGEKRRNGIHRISLPTNLFSSTNEILLMGLCSGHLYYSILINYKIE